jgi:hypothetical protein
MSGCRREAAGEQDGTGSYRGAQSNRLALVRMALLPSIERSAHSRGSYLNETFRRTR